MSKKIKPPEPSLGQKDELGEFCFLDDNLYQAQRLLTQLSADLLELVLKKGVQNEKTIDLDLGLDADLLDQFRQIAQDFGKSIADWARITVAELSYFIEELRAIIGLKQRETESQF